MKTFKLKPTRLMSFDEADRLIERYYDGITSGEEEKRLQAFLSQARLPERYAPEQAIFGYFGSQKTQKSVLLRSVLGWASGAAALLVLAIGIQLLLQPASAANYAYVDGHKITNMKAVKTQALSSIENVTNGDNEVKQSLDNVSDQRLIEQQLDVFSGE